MKWVCTPGRLKPVSGQQTRDWNKDKADNMEKLFFLTSTVTIGVSYQQRWSCKVYMPNGPSIGVGDTFCRCVSVLCQIALLG